jgi:hypothetical protein
MRDPCLHLTIAFTGLIVLCSPANVHAAEPEGRSTIRTVSVAGVPAKTESAENLARFSRSTSGQSSRAHQGEGSAGSSTVTFVEIPARQSAEEEFSVRQVQFTSAISPPATPAEPTATSAANSPAWVFREPTRDERFNVSQTAPVNVGTTSAQTPVTSSTLPRASHRAPAPPSVPAWHPADPSLTSQTRQVLDYFGSSAARATLSQLPRRTPIQPSGATPPRQRTKPFQGIQSDPTVSPYLNLHRNEVEDETAPNYHSFVRPQLEQMEANRRQQLEIMRLQRQMQATSTTVAMPQYRNATATSVRPPARYMDTAQFYSGWPR